MGYDNGFRRAQQMYDQQEPPDEGDDRTNLKLYLAHPLAARHLVREAELDFEKRTGIELVNPFYDTTRSDIKRIDEGEATRWESDVRTIVDVDLDLIEQCDGVLAVLTKDRMVGTIMEIVYGFQMGKHIYILDFADLARHPWIRYHSLDIYTSWEQFLQKVSP